VIKAKVPNILKKDTSDALIFSMRFFLEEIKLQKTERSPKPIWNPTYRASLNFC